MANPRIRTLVVDDSIFMRTVLQDGLGTCADIEVIGSAQNGLDALEKIEKLRPDVVTLDIEMPGLTGLEVLQRVMKSDKKSPLGGPIPIVMVSTKTQEGAQMTFEALDLGAFDYVAKPLADKSASLQKFKGGVVEAVKAAFASNRLRVGKIGRTRILRPRAAALRTEDTIVAIGISAGGPATLRDLIPTLPACFPPIVLTQHMPPEFTGPFAARLDAASKITVKEAESGDELLPGRLLIAPGHSHLKVRRRGNKVKVVLDTGPKVSGFRPSVDVLFESVAKVYGEDAIGLVMTGMGWDGAEGVRKLKAAGAKTLAQDKDSSIVYGMPKAAAATGCVDRVVSLAEIPTVLTRMLTASEPSATL